MKSRKKQRMDADKGQFDEVLRRMVRKNPQKTVEIKAFREDDPGSLGRRKNPYEGPLPPDYKPDTEPLPPDRQAEAKRQQEFFAEQERKKKR